MTGGEVLALLLVITGFSLADPHRDTMWILGGLILMATGILIVTGELILSEF